MFIWEADCCAYLDFVGNPSKIHVCPARLGPIWHKRSANGRIQHNELLVSLVEIICGEHLSVSANVVAIIRSLDYPDVELLWNKFYSICLSIENEDKVRRSIEAVSKKKFEVLSGILALLHRLPVGVGVENKRSFGNQWFDRGDNLGGC